MKVAEYFKRFFLDKTKKAYQGSQ